MNPFTDKHFLCLAGGGPKGHVYTGALKAISYLAPQFLSELRGVVGTSVGALFATLLACRLPLPDLARLVGDIRFNELVNISVDWTSYGLDGGKCLRELIQTTLEQLLGSSGVTFQQLYQLTGVRLVVVVTNVDTGLAEYHGKTASSWHLPILDSLQASCSIPILFAPVSIRGTRYIDGGVVDNFAFHTFNMQQTVGLRFSNSAGPITSLKSYLYRVLTLPVDKLAEHQFRSIPACYRHHNVVTFQVDDSPSLYYESKVQELVKLGFEGVYNFIERQQAHSTLVLGMLVACRTAPAAGWRGADWRRPASPEPAAAEPPPAAGQ
jgi:predicted acylesterase/phospholipase RssA